MSTFLSSNKNKILLVLFILSLTPFIAKLFQGEDKIYVKKERFNPSLKVISNMDKLMTYANKTPASRLASAKDTGDYVLNLSNIIKDRFYHYDLVYSFSENWIAWLSGKLLWSHMSFIVLPNDILKHPHSICSQQIIVFMEVLNRKGISVRSVGLGYDEGPGHFVCEVRYGGGWHMYDISIEPDWNKIENDHLNVEHYLANKELLYEVYEQRMSRELLDTILIRHSYGEVNKLPARNMKLFHLFTYVLTYLIPLSFGLLLLLSFLKNKKQRETLSPETPEFSGSTTDDNPIKEKINS